MTSKKSKEEAKELLQTVDSLRKKVVGKSIPDEKFAAKKAQMYIDQESNLSLAIPEAAYVFNYLKIGNVSEKTAKFWRQYVKQQVKSCAGKCFFYAPQNQLRKKLKPINQIIKTIWPWRLCSICP